MCGGLFWGNFRGFGAGRGVVRWGASLHYSKAGWGPCGAFAGCALPGNRVRRTRFASAMQAAQPRARSRDSAGCSEGLEGRRLTFFRICGEQIVGGARVSPRTSGLPVRRKSPRPRPSTGEPPDGPKPSRPCLGLSCPGGPVAAALRGPSGRRTPRLGHASLPAERWPRESQRRLRCESIG